MNNESGSSPPSSQPAVDRLVSFATRSGDGAAMPRPVRTSLLVESLMSISLWLPAIVLGSAAATGALVAAGRNVPVWMGPTAVLGLNLLPPFLVGAALFRVVGARRLANPESRPGREGHAARMVLLYFIAAFLSTIVVMATVARDEGFWLFGQIILWPAMTTIGAIAGDALAVRRPTVRPSEAQPPVISS